MTIIEENVAVHMYSGITSGRVFEDIHQFTDIISQIHQSTLHQYFPTQELTHFSIHPCK